MTVHFQTVYHKLRGWAESCGIQMTERQMEPGKAGEFKGISVVMNSSYDVEEQTYYLVHALGSIVRWSLSHQDVQKMFNELRDAKKGDDRGRLERAIDHYRGFEIESSEFAVWLLAELGHAEVAPSYSNFMRADLEALTEFHRTGKAPVWRDFFSRWNEEVVAGHRQLPSFSPKQIPDFRPCETEKQEILQQQ